MNIWEDSNNAFEDLTIFGQHKTKVTPCRGHDAESEEDERVYIDEKNYYKPKELQRFLEFNRKYISGIDPHGKE